MSTTTTLSSKFQISIPKEVRERQGWKPGQKFAFLPRGLTGYVLVAVPTLVRRLPEPIKKIIGDLSNDERVLVGLNLLALKG